jgi:hypothetical protein
MDDVERERAEKNEGDGRLFTCSECGGPVSLKTGVGRTKEFRRGDPPMPVPEDFAIPTCMECGESYLQVDQEAALNTILEAAYREWSKGHLRAIVDGLMRRTEATLSEVACVLGLTTSFLQALLDGELTVSIGTERLLEAYAVYPPAFEVHLRADRAEAEPEPEMKKLHAGGGGPRLVQGVTAINLSVAVKRLAKDIRKAIERNGFVLPSGAFADDAAASLVNIFGRLAAQVAHTIGAPGEVFLATMAVQWEETADPSPDATKPPELVLLKG